MNRDIGAGPAGTGDSDDPDDERDGEAKIKEVLGVQ